MNGTERRALPWREVEIVLTGPSADNPYLDLELVVDFVHESGETVTRPAFWDGGRTWRVRFASPRPEGSWTWSVRGEFEVSPARGQLTSAPAEPGGHPVYAHGFVTVAPEARAGRHADGTPWLAVADTAWAMPWRAVVEDVATYAADRRDKGFNAVLLMTVQPDMRATGPRGRNVDEGFEVGFEDLVDPRDGSVVRTGRLPPGGGVIEDDSTDPRVLLCSTVTPRIAE